MLEPFPKDKTEKEFQELLNKEFKDHLEAEIKLAIFVQIANSTGHRGKFGKA